VVVRPKSSSGSESVLRRHAGVSGVRGSASGLPKLRQSEAGAGGVFGGQSVLYQALCLLCGAALPPGNHQGRSQGTQLNWYTVKELDKQYMKAQLSRGGKPKPKVIGVDEVSIRKGHTYRIVVSDLERDNAQSAHSAIPSSLHPR